MLWRLEAGVGHLIVDSFDEIERSSGSLEAPQDVLVRVTPGIKPSTHDYDRRPASSTRSSASALEDGLAARAVERVLASDGLELVGPARPHRLADLRAGRPTRSRSARWRAGRRLVPRRQHRRRARHRLHRARTSRPRSTAYAEVKVRGVAEVFGDGVKILVEPGRSLVGNAGVTALPRRHRQGRSPASAPTSPSTAACRTTCGRCSTARVYEAVIADRAGDCADRRLTIAGMHCESGDVIVREARLADPRVGDVLVTPATGAYGHAMASNYNGVPRPPVVFCRDGEARVVVRRETYEDLTAAMMSETRFASGCSAAARSAAPSPS